MDVVEQVGRSEEQTGAHMLHELRLEDALPAALVGESRAEDHGDPQAGQELVGTALPSSTVGHRGS